MYNLLGCISSFMSYLDEHNGSMMFLITFVYVIATIFICRANIASANATKEQVEESNRQFEEGNRAFVTVTFEIIKNGIAVLHIKNHGKRIAENVRVRVSTAFLENVQDERDREQLEELCSASFTLGIEQSWYICIGSHLQLKQLSKELLEIQVSYSDNKSEYSEEIRIDLSQYFWSMIYESPTSELRKDIKEISKELHEINCTIKK